MNGACIGHLDRRDPLYAYLRDHIAPQFGFFEDQADYRVFGFGASPDVFGYEERHGRVRVVGKFYRRAPRNDPDKGRRTAHAEYNNLVFLRGLGFDRPPHTVVRALGCCPDLGNLLVMEYVEGDLLCRVIEDALRRGRRDRLFRKLTGLAWFLASLHNRTAGEHPVNFGESCDYMGRLIHSLSSRRGLRGDQAEEFFWLRQAWRDRSFMWEDREVLVHGDATPSNFLFGRGKDVLAIDLERMKWADRVFDLGRLCGELKHFFFRAWNDPLAAEPFIGHFLWEYCCHFPDRDAAFRSVTRRIPFHMGITLLRIARNSWIDWDYRGRLIHEARTILRAIP